jgi:tripartite-type tricarboxylate transporter receptor subunit TctC
MSVTGMKMTHVPYKSDVDALRETISGSVQVGMMATMNTVAFIRAGKVLAVTTTQRVPELPDVPSLTESGIKGLGALEPHTFVAFVGPPGLPPAIVTTLNDTINKISAMPDVVTRVRNNLYSEPVTSTPSSFREFLEKEIAKWKELGKTVKLPDL